MIVLEELWFTEPRRFKLKSYIDQELRVIASELGDLTMLDQTKDEVIYRISSLSAKANVLRLIDYLTSVDGTKKPWLAKKRVITSLGINEFRKYIADTLDWLTSQAPNQNYSTLVTIHATINLLTTMEIRNGRRS